MFEYDKRTQIRVLNCKRNLSTKYISFNHGWFVRSVSSWSPPTLTSNYVSSSFSEHVSSEYCCIKCISLKRNSRHFLIKIGIKDGKARTYLRQSLETTGATFTRCYSTQGIIMGNVESKVPCYTFYIPWVLRKSTQVDNDPFSVSTCLHCFNTA